MVRRLEYLYGDSTPSSLHHDYIALLRDALDFAAPVMAAEEKAAEARARASQHAVRVSQEIERAERLHVELAALLERRAAEDDAALPARWAKRVREDLRGALRAESEAAQGVVNEERARAAECGDASRQACKVALETLLIRQELPGAKTAATLTARGPSGYQGTWRGHTGYGLEWITRLDVAGAPLLRQALRVERLVGPLSVRAPKMVGWFHREEKLRAQRLDRLFLRELVVDDAATVVKLRKKAHGKSLGFDLLFANDPPRVEIRRVQGGGEPTGASHVVEGGEVAKLLALRDALGVLLRDLMEHRDVLLEASLDDTPLEALDAPRELVERLLASLAPTVDQIARRSLVPGELVMKRVLDDNHREEVFLSRAELRQRLDALPPAVRRGFAHLRLWDGLDPLERKEGNTIPFAPAPESTPRLLGHAEPAGEDGEAEHPSARPQPPGAANSRPALPMSTTGRWPAFQAPRSDRSPPSTAH